LVVADPDKAAALLAETILGDVAALLEQLRLLGLDGSEVLECTLFRQKSACSRYFSGQ